MEYAYQHSTGTQITRKDFEGGEKHHVLID